MGESELVLDGMSIDEALRIVTGGGTGRRIAAPVDEPEIARRADTAERRAAPNAAAASDTADWREALRATGAGPHGARSGAGQIPAEEPSVAPPASASASVSGSA